MKNANILVSFGLLALAVSVLESTDRANHAPAAVPRLEITQPITPATSTTGTTGSSKDDPLAVFVAEAEAAASQSTPTAFDAPGVIDEPEADEPVAAAVTLTTLAGDCSSGSCSIFGATSSSSGGTVRRGLFGRRIVYTSGRSYDSNSRGRWYPGKLVGRALFGRRR